MVPTFMKLRSTIQPQRGLRAIPRLAHSPDRQCDRHAESDGGALGLAAEGSILTLPGRTLLSKALRSGPYGIRGGCALLDLVGVCDQAQGCQVVAHILPKILPLDLKEDEVRQRLHVQAAGQQQGAAAFRARVHQLGFRMQRSLLTCR